MAAATTIAKIAIKTLESNNNHTNSTQLLSFLSILVDDQMAGGWTQASANITQRDTRFAGCGCVCVYVCGCVRLDVFSFYGQQIPMRASKRYKKNNLQQPH